MKCKVQLRMIPSLPSDIAKISAPLVVFSGDSSLGVYLADRFFRDGSEHYNIEFLDSKNGSTAISLKAEEKDESQRIMKGAWYKKHSHYQPAICIFCVSVDANKLATDRENWLSSVTRRLQSVEACYAANTTQFLSVFVCSGSRSAPNLEVLREDSLTREWLFLPHFTSSLNSILDNNSLSYLFYEEELIGSSFSGIKEMKKEVHRACHEYYSRRLEMLDSDMRMFQTEIPPGTVMCVA